MPGDSPAIDELRRRVQKDPASIAFAHLAEELRKAGQYDEAVHVCRAGLERHPTYLSAHVTLGRALLALQQYGEARTEIEYVLRVAPDNLLAIKCMNELQSHDGNPAGPAPGSAEAGPHVPAPEPGPHVQPILEPPRLDLRVQKAPEPPGEAPIAAPVAEAAPEPAEPDLRGEAAPEPRAGAVCESGPPSQHWPVGSQSDLTSEAATAAGPHVPEVSAAPNGGPPAEHPAIAELEAWQASIQADRARRPQ
jgi:tetratricopeptide (TPR) repeat protein